MTMTQISNTIKTFESAAVFAGVVVVLVVVNVVIVLEKGCLSRLIS
ncbi:MAG: hypothetical protein AB7E85_09350 [Pseudobdellovibrionaceae bacterium]